VRLAPQDDECIVGCPVVLIRARTCLVSIAAAARASHQVQARRRVHVKMLRCGASDCLAGSLTAPPQGLGGGRNFPASIAVDELLPNSQGKTLIDP
jgi:hypothetical protein